MLDSCLYDLEDANERGEETVPVAVVRRFGGYVTELAAGMPILEALDLVFLLQERQLSEARRGGIEVAGAGASGPAARSRDNESPAKALTAPEARKLTDEIRHGHNHISTLLLAAHRGRAWKALGYRTWESYTREEFGLSRSRSYELLIHGRVLAVVRSASNLSGIPDISPFTALRIKPMLSELEVQLRSRCAQLPADRAHAVISETIASLLRSRAASVSVARPEPGLETRDRDERAAGTADALAQLYAAVEYLAGAAPPRTVARSIPAGDEPHLRSLPAAVRWLTDFSREWAMREHGSPGGPATDPSIALLSVLPTAQLVASGR